MREHLREILDDLAEISVELKCAKEFAGVEKILATGASYERQLRVADDNDGDLRAVVRHLVTEFRDGPTLRDHLNALR